jgi:hypothetical protein
MSTWTIVSWVMVAILTTINIVVFLKLKSASEQMLKMAFPNAKNMNDALSQMQSLMGKMGVSGGLGGLGAGKGNPLAGLSRGAGGGSDAQLKAAMETLQRARKKGR